MEQSSYTTAVTPFPEHALSSDVVNGKSPVGTCALETDHTKECICHLEVRHEKEFIYDSLVFIEVFTNLNLLCFMSLGVCQLVSMWP